MKIKKECGGGGTVYAGEGCSGWGSGWGVRLDVNEELKFFVNIQKKKNLWGVRGVGLGGRVWGGGGGKAGCKRRIEVFVNIQKKKYFFFFLGGGGGGRWGVREEVNKELKFL